MPPSAKDHIPLLHVLRKLPPDDRQIILSHLDHKSCGQIENCLSKVLRQKKKMNAKTREALSACMRNHSKDFETFFTARSAKTKIRALTRVGGNPLALLLRVGLPLLISLFSSKK